ncbi:hypothetical protein Amac_057410 [Acrocarpospora macrocephala]|uniref:Uncharacterized protein n=1 Tax=Acrocarpospora macrocephala TaxID=150177 RepID=A0A5M3WTC5_9ACTN|nr:hypothetical protein Amac_057410 [Acrocarpospora macrocephala]
MAAVVMSLTFCAAFVLPFMAASDAYAQQRPAHYMDASRGARGVVVMTPHRPLWVDVRSSLWSNATISRAPDHSGPNPAFMGVKLTDLNKLHTWYAHVRNPGQTSAVHSSTTASRADLPRTARHAAFTHTDTHMAAFTVPGARGPPTRTDL